jgi:hypothetical protein
VFAIAFAVARIASNLPFIILLKVVRFNPFQQEGDYYCTIFQDTIHFVVLPMCFHRHKISLSFNLLNSQLWYKRQCICKNEVEKEKKISFLNLFITL